MKIIKNKQFGNFTQLSLNGCKWYIVPELLKRLNLNNGKHYILNQFVGDDDKMLITRKTHPEIFKELKNIPGYINTSQLTVVNGSGATMILFRQHNADELLQLHQLLTK